MATTGAAPRLNAPRGPPWFYRIVAVTCVVNISCKISEDGFLPYAGGTRRPYVVGEDETGSRRGKRNGGMDPKELVIGDRASERFYRRVRRRPGRLATWGTG